ncbi:MAG: hypothetical protein ACI3YK_02915 [Eubacteriales bacterium]
MKQEEKLMRALTEINDQYIQESESGPIPIRHTRKGHARIIAIASAACLCCAGIICGSVMLLYRSEPGMTTDDRVFATKIVAKDDLGEAAYLVPKWDEMRIYQQFPETAFNGRTYVASGYRQTEQEIYRDNALDKSLIGEAIGSAELQGYDVYTETAFTHAAQLFELSDISPDCAIAVRFEGQEEFYPYLCHEYRPDTLEDFVNSLNLKNTLTLTGSAYCEYKKSNGNYATVEFVGLNADAVWEMLLDDLSAVNEARDDSVQTYSIIMSFGVSIPKLAVENLSMSVTEDGYLITNLLATRKVFYIGPNKTRAFVDYVMNTLVGYEWVYEDEIAEPESEAEPERTVRAFNPSDPG